MTTMLNDTIMESEYFVLRDLLDNYSKMLIMEDYVMEQETENDGDDNNDKGGESVFTKIKNAIMKVINMIINVIKKIGNFFKSFRSKKYKKISEVIIHDKAQCAQIGRKLQTSVSQTTTEYFVQEADELTILKKAGENLLKDSKELAKELGDSAVNMGKKFGEIGTAAGEKAWGKLEDYAYRDDIAFKSARDAAYETAHNAQVRHMKSYGEYIGPKMIDDGAKAGVVAAASSSAPSGILIGASVVGAILICAAIFIIISKYKNCDLPEPREIDQTCKNISTNCDQLVEVIKNTNTGSIKRIKSPIDSSSKNVMRRVNNWRTKYENNKISVDKNSKSLTQTQERLLADAAYFCSLSNEYDFKTSMNELTKKLENLKSAINKLPDDMEKNVKTKVYNVLTNTMKSYIEFVVSIQSIQKIGMSAMENMAMAAKTLEKSKLYA